MHHRALLIALDGASCSAEPSNWHPCTPTYRLLALQARPSRCRTFPTAAIPSFSIAGLNSLPPPFRLLGALCLIVRLLV